MPSYKVTMLSSTGRTTTEVMPADDASHVLSLVKQRGLYCVSYELVTTYTKRHLKLNLDALVVFCYQMSAMLGAGVSLIEALKMIQMKAKNEKQRTVYRNLYEEVQKGNALSVAMMLQEGTFPPLLISMVHSGELSGSLGEVLETMSLQYDREKRVRNKLKSASIYPLVLLLVSIAVVLILVVFVLPSITQSFPASSMPFLTRCLLSVSGFMITKWYVVLLILTSVFALVYLALIDERMRRRIDKRLLYLPVFGKLMRTIYSARAARSFASLYRHGVPALKMIELTGTVLGNAYLGKEFERVYIEVSRGGSISKAIESIEEFDPMLGIMIRVGEETGDLEGILSKIAVYFDEESESAMSRLVSLVEPIMIVVLGIIVALLVLAIIQPIFTMYDHVQ